jgi:hypothetical protein
MFLKPSIALELEMISFPMVDVADDSKVVWGKVSDLALRERAMRDGVKTGLEKQALFERYRQDLEMLASEAYDDRHFVNEPDGTIVVRVTNGML